MALGEQGDNGAQALTGREGVQVEQTATQTGQTRRPRGKGLPVQHCEASLETDTYFKNKSGCAIVRTSLQDRDIGQHKGQCSN